jgi:hypothetical protein
VTSTARHRGCVGSNPRLIRWMRSLGWLQPEIPGILDFGSGPHGRHVNQLFKEGIRGIWGYDHTSKAFRVFDDYETARHLGPWNIVYLSNVINIQYHMLQAYDTLQEAWSLVAPGGWMAWNWPAGGPERWGNIKQANELFNGFQINHLLKGKESISESLLGQTPGLYATRKAKQ